MDKNKQIKIIEISHLFDQFKYEIPIYQRNYAWKENEINQLIEDIKDSEVDYYLGNLIVNQKDTNVFEVIDGQQRLTTLYLLMRYMDIDISKGALYFEARNKSNKTLNIIGRDDNDYISEELISKEIIQGYDIIKDYFKGDKYNEDKVKRRLDNVKLIRIQVPQNIDLNHYFEIMNTRGEQLEFHEIAKAKLLGMLSRDDEKKAGSMIWEACSDMSSYIQMNFKKKVRNQLFSKKWNVIKSDIKTFDGLKQAIKSTINDDKSNLEEKSLLNILKKPSQNDYEEEDKSDEENSRFESIISFPNFLLQVNKVVSYSSENESSLDDKKFLDNMSNNWRTEESAKRFFYKLLECRFLFDKFIVKREYIGNHKETGEWSLKKLESYSENKSSDLKPKYVGTFDINNNKIIRSLESCMRITYTSPKTMNWISITLRGLLDNNLDLKTILEGYAKKEIEKSDYRKSSGFEFERIVFIYLDYILYRDGYSYEEKEVIKKLNDSWEFQFRNSIEHFYPQNPIDYKNDKYGCGELLDSFGNLALITISGNSKFSNLPPKGKIESYPQIFKQSLKLQIMKYMIEDKPNEQIKVEIEKHEKEMLNLLYEEISS